MTLAEPEDRMPLPSSSSGTRSRRYIKNKTKKQRFYVNLFKTYQVFLIR